MTSRSDERSACARKWKDEARYSYLSALTGSILAARRAGM